MTFVEFVDHNKDVLVAFMTLISAMVSAVVGIIGTVATYGNRARTSQKIESVRADLQNGVGDAIAQKAVAQMKPAIDEATVTATTRINGAVKVAATIAADKIVQRADAAADKIVQKADETAAKLAETNGVMSGKRKE